MWKLLLAWLFHFIAWLKYIPFEHLVSGKHEFAALSQRSTKGCNHVRHPLHLSNHSRHLAGGGVCFGDGVLSRSVFLVLVGTSPLSTFLLWIWLPLELKTWWSWKMVVCKQSSGQCFIYFKGLCKSFVMNKGERAFHGSVCKFYSLPIRIIRLVLLLIHLANSHRLKLAHGIYKAILCCFNILFFTHTDILPHLHSFVCSHCLLGEIWRVNYILKSLPTDVSTCNIC